MCSESHIGSNIRPNRVLGKVNDEPGTSIFENETYCDVIQPRFNLKTWGENIFICMSC